MVLSAWLREGCLPFILVTLAHLVVATKKKKKEKERKRGIKASRNPPAISIHPIGRRMDACWKGFGDSALQERRTEGVAKEVSCPRTVHADDAAYRFYFYPDRLPRRVHGEVPSLKERFQPPYPPPSSPPRLLIPLNIGVE